MAEQWQSVLVKPARYRVMTPSQVVAGIDEDGPWDDWRRWLAERYLT
jgi:hypothetical protein